MICPYCGRKADYSTSKEFYGTDYNGTNVYHCDSCDSRVGTHRGTNKPFGTMANSNLRKLRKECHNLIDPFWKSGRYKRKVVYKRLSNIMGKDNAHIGGFDEEDCLKLIDYFKNK